MKVPKLLKRFYYHFFRYKTAVGLAILWFVAIILSFGAMYPGDEPFSKYVEYLSFMFPLEVENPGYHLWLVFGNDLHDFLS